MEDEETFGNGVVSVFDAIASEHGDKTPAARAPSKAAKHEPVEAKKKSARTEQSERPKARIGRFPGSKNGPPKEKITGRIVPELKDAYVNWALDDRCALSDLMERALTEFYQKHRAAAEKS